jgi:protein-disulfide isomerase/uncharacterized membrane protein
LGLGGNSLCEISSQINCDAAATSSYSEIFGIPLAVLGAVFHLILLCFVVGHRLGWVESSSYLKVSLRSMLTLAAATSVAMGFISLFVIKVACPFCIATYVFSIINAVLGWNLIQDASKDNFEPLAYFSDYKSHLISLALIPLLAWIISGMIQDNYGLSEIKKQIPEKIAIWKAGTQYNFDPAIGLTKKASTAEPRYKIVEFADFKCPHCKVASDTIKAFLKGKNDIEFTYKPYPLDGQCNSAMERTGDGSRCAMAAYVLCAEQLEQKGWPLHHYFFENQARFMSVTNIKTLHSEIQSELGLNTEALATCAESAAIYDVLRKSSEEGAVAKVEGTPTIYVNGRKLPWGQFMAILQAATAEQ